MQRRALVTGTLAAAGTTLLPPELALAAPGLPAALDSDHAGRHGRQTPIVIGHRGASGYRPEHTLEAYGLAIALGADYIEPDLVSTSDGHLVARHENEISGTTDVATKPEFADRKTTKTIDGASVTGWFTEDFTLVELKTLRAIERLPAVRPHNTVYDGLFEVPTLLEVIELAKSESRRLGRTIGVYPETKHPSYFASIGKALEPPLVRTLKRSGWADRKAPVYVQSFETGNLRALRDQLDVPIIALLDATGRPWDLPDKTYAELATPKGLRWIRTYADGIGVNKNLVIPRDPAGSLTQPSSLVADAHALGLVVHAWTFRNEDPFLPADLRKGTDQTAWGDPIREYERFFAAGLDGLFSDFPDTAVLARAHQRATT